MDESVVRVPPNSVDAERSALGAMLRSREMLTLGFELLRQDDFYQPGHREIFEAMRTLMLTNKPCDLVTLSAELQRRGTLEGVGGDQYLIEIMAGVPSTVHARAYMQIVDEKAQTKKIVSQAVTPVPLIILHPDFKASTIATPIMAERIAPTLANAIHIRAPNGCTLLPLAE